MPWAVEKDWEQLKNLTVDGSHVMLEGQRGKNIPRERLAEKAPVLAAMVNSKQYDRLICQLG